METIIERDELIESNAKKSSELIRQLTFYAVVNYQGKFFHRKGYGGYGQSWADDPKQARIYSKIGHARSIVTYFSNDKKYPIPRIIEMKIGEVTVIDQSERVAEQKKKKAIQEAANDKNQKKRELAEAEQAYNLAKERLSKAKKGDK